MIKNILTSVVFFLGFYFINAQNVNYTNEYDEPFVPRYNFSLNLLQMEVSETAFTENLSYNLGGFGYYNLTDRLGFRINMNKSIFSFARFTNKEYTGVFELNLGANYNLLSSTKTKNTKIVLSTKNTTTNYGNTDVSVSKFIKVPAKYIINTGVRGGLYLRRNPYSTDRILNLTNDSNTSSTDAVEANMSAVGVYAGIIRKKFVDKYVKTDKYGVKGLSKGGEWYFDALIVPSNTFKSVDEAGIDVKQDVKDVISASPIGFRIGYASYEIEKKWRSDKTFGASLNTEFGYRPYLGIFWNVGVGLTILKGESI